MSTSRKAKPRTAPKRTFTTKEISNPTTAELARLRARVDFLEAEVESIRKETIEALKVSAEVITETVMKGMVPMAEVIAENMRILFKRTEGMR